MRTVYSYAYVNALTEHELLKAAPDDDARKNSGTYVVFTSEYHASKTAVEFQQKVRARVDNEKMFASDEERDSAYKTDFTPVQIAVWTICAANHGGGVLLFTQQVTPSDSFTLRLHAVTPKRSGQQTVTLNVVNATIDGAPSKTEVLSGEADRTYTVVRSPGLPSAVVKVTATSTTGSDMLAVPRQWTQVANRCQKTAADVSSRTFRGTYKYRDTHFNILTKQVNIAVDFGRQWTEVTPSPDHCEVRLAVDKRGFYTPAARSDLTKAEWADGFTVHSGPAESASVAFCSLRVEPSSADVVAKSQTGAQRCR